MALNHAIFQGRIPQSDKLPYAINDYGSDEKKAVLRGMISVPRKYKKEGEQYYPEDLLFFKAFGQTAVFINKYFKRGDNLILETEVRKDDDYEKDGQAVRGQMYLHVIQGGVHFQKGNAKDETNDETTSAAPTKAAPVQNAKPNPLTANRNGLAGVGNKRSVI